jgi:hypothetical protein
MATWNALPGDKSYPTKRYLEGIALKLVGGNLGARADLQSQFVDQRFHEATTLLSESSSSAGLNDLVLQIQASKADIVAAKKRVGGKDAVVAQEKSTKLVAQLKEYNQKLEESKSLVRVVTPTSTPTASAKPMQASPNPSVLPSPSASTVSLPVIATPPILDPIIETQQKIEQVIIELEGNQGIRSEENDHKDAKSDKNNDDGKNDKNDRDRKDTRSK